MQLMTNLISNTISTLEEVGGGSLEDLESTDISSTANKDKVLSIVNEALFAAKIADQVSGAATLKLSTQLDLGALIEEMNRSTRSRGEPIETMIRINKVGGVVQLTGKLDEFANTESTGDNIQTWYNNL